MLINDGMRHRNAGNHGSGSEEAEATQWCLCLVCSPFYFLLIDLLSVPYAILSCCGCGTHCPCSAQRVNDDFLRNHPTKVNDDWATRHPEMVPTHLKAHEIWRKYEFGKKLPNRRYKLEIFSLRRMRLLHKLVRYTRLKENHQHKKAEAMSIVKHMFAAKKIVRDGMKWTTKIVEKNEQEARPFSGESAPVSQRFVRLTDAPANPLSQNLMPKDTMAQEDTMTLKDPGTKATKSFTESFIDKGAHFQQALDACIAAKYSSSMFSPELLQVLDMCLAASATERAAKDREATIYCPGCSEQTTFGDQFCSECGHSLAGVAELQAAERAAEGSGVEKRAEYTQEVEIDNIKVFEVGQFYTRSDRARWWKSPLRVNSTRKAGSC
jgi:hypothetical protein